MMSDLQARLRGWLEEHGIPLEMRAAEILRGAGVHGDHYRVFQDPATGKVRELDVVGYLDHKTLSVHLVFECKHSKDKPWVIFSTRRKNLTARGYVSSIPATPSAAKRLDGVADNSAVHAMELFHAPERIGFRLMRAFGDNQDAAFQAISGVSVGATAMAKDIGQHGHSVLFPPVVVVDSPLFECYLADLTGELCTDALDRGVVLHPTQPGRFALVHVVHVDALPGFVHSINENVSRLRTLLA